MFTRCKQLSEDFSCTNTRTGLTPEKKTHHLQDDVTYITHPEIIGHLRCDDVSLAIAGETIGLVTDAVAFFDETLICIVDLLPPLVENKALSVFFALDYRYFVLLQLCGREPFKKISRLLNLKRYTHFGDASFYQTAAYHMTCEHFELQELYDISLNYRNYMTFL